MITGFTSNKLSEVKSYKRNNPYIVGVNGVTDVIILSGEIERVDYTINEINYETVFDDEFTTRFVVTNPNELPYSEKNIIKEEINLGIVFPPKIDDEVFIERGSSAVMEPHIRLSEIKTLDRLVEYRNGYYNIKE